jgi:hypothetical protein
MTFDPQSRIGAQLYALLPEVYRNRDRDANEARDEHLRLYLDASGELFDRIYQTLRQRLDDHFPDTCQEWLLPYFAELLDVSLESPEPQGRRAEVARAIAWRQTKGTAICAEEIAEAVGAMEVELQEGWRRVARTPDVGEKLLPAVLLGAAEPERSNPSRAAQHPGLPVVTVDFRKRSRAVRATEPNLVTQRTRYPGQVDPVLWSQANPRGVPCFPGSYEDRSARTADVRTPDFGRGHFHPKRLLVFMPPPVGFFADDTLQFDWAQRDQAVRDGLLEVSEAAAQDPDSGTVLRRTVYRRPATQKRAVKIRGAITFSAGGPANEERSQRFEGLQLEAITLEADALELARCAVLTVNTPTLSAVDCLFNQVTASTAQLEYCTVLQNTVCSTISAVDCLFVGELQQADGSRPSIACLRHVRIAPRLLEQLAPAATDSEALRQEKLQQRNRVQRFTTEVPVLLRSEFGVAGSGVLHPASAAAIRAGAEDGGELGAYHHQRLCLRESAVRAKLADYLPFGIEAVLIPDPRLRNTPPVKSSQPNLL